MKTENAIEKLSITPAEEAFFSGAKQTEVLENIKQFSDHRQISRKIRDPIFENVRNGFLPDNYRVWLPFIYSDLGALADYLPVDASIIAFEPEQIKIELEQTLAFLRKEEARYEQPYWISPDFELLYPRAQTLIDDALARADFVARAAPFNDLARTAIAVEPVTQDRLSEKEIHEWLDDGFFCVDRFSGFNPSRTFTFFAQAGTE